MAAAIVIFFFNCLLLLRCKTRGRRCLLLLHYNEVKPKDEGDSSCHHLVCYFRLVVGQQNQRKKATATHFAVMLQQEKEKKERKEGDCSRCRHLLHCAVAQRSKEKKKKAMVATLPSLPSLRCIAAKKKKKEGDGSVLAVTF